MRHLALLALLLAGAACRRDPIGADLDRLEAVLELTPAQKPAWEAFRREAAAAGNPGAAWRVQYRDALSGERFDAPRAQSAADAARADAGRLITAWARLDETLSPGQRASVLTLLSPE